jgi:hemolysin D
MTNTAQHLPTEPTPAMNSDAAVINEQSKQHPLSLWVRVRVRVLSFSFISGVIKLRDTVGHHLDIWRSAYQFEKQQEGKSPTRAHVAFLPAVMEIQETPPSPHGRALVYLVVGALVLAIGWATWGEIDIITVAQGKIIPSDYSKTIQPLESGIVKAIHVRDGQVVKTGEVLIELDTTATGADEQRVAHEAANARVEAARLRSLLSGNINLTASADADPTFVKLQQQLLLDQLGEWQGKSHAARSLVAQREAALKVTEADIQRLEVTLPMIQERAKSMQDMVKQGYVSRTEFLKSEEERVTKEQELAMQRHKRTQDKAAWDEANRNYQSLVANFKQTTQAELAQIETKIASMSKEEVKATNRNQQQTLTAPIDGVVQQLAVHTVGGVVTPAQQLMVIAPQQGQMEVEAWIENKDIGFVDAGQEAEIKVEAFPFTKYGVIPGSLLHLSQDAVPMDKVGYVYTTRVRMDKHSIDVGNKEINLTPGMNVSVEIKTGKRRVIEYVLTPLMNGIKEAGRER